MFSYYGGKSKVIDLYHVPKYGKIIEPFAGSARYALKYWDRDVLLVDKYDVIVKLWQWLQKCSVSDIMGLPDVRTGQSLDDFNLSQEEKWLIGFCINRGSAQPKKTAKEFNSWGENRKYISDQLFKIRDWTIRAGDYTEVGNEAATYFVDPPYQFGGEWYVEGNGNMDYAALAQWCETRNGQVIVCENTKARWLPFSPLKGMGGQLHKTTEAVWYNDVQQLSMF
jgi:site-specific DNA-adenine methylase